MSHITSQALIDFVYHEAELLDTKALDAWLALFAEDGVYWMPLQPDQQDARLVGSLMYEDRVLLATRVERLKGHILFNPRQRRPSSRSRRRNLPRDDFFIHAIADDGYRRPERPASSTGRASRRSPGGWGGGGVNRHG